MLDLVPKRNEPQLYRTVALCSYIFARRSIEWNIQISGEKDANRRRQTGKDDERQIAFCVHMDGYLCIHLHTCGYLTTSAFWAD
ncbi:hypothetical protein BD309DRAFT_958658 [Dichomitus squalens]|nr:hypothetical protein BD309DRAFT_958658 [Dichomitus squalens]